MRRASASSLRHSSAFSRASSPVSPAGRGVDGVEREREAERGWTAGKSRDSEETVAGRRGRRRPRVARARLGVVLAAEEEVLAAEAAAETTAAEVDRALVTVPLVADRTLVRA